MLFKNQRNLERNLVHNGKSNIIGTLLFCLDYAANWNLDLAGVWRDVKQVFNDADVLALYPVIKEMNDFRNKHVAHIDQPLTDTEAAERAMQEWIRGLAQMYAIV